jgi:hypothetical protein
MPVQRKEGFGRRLTGTALGKKELRGRELRERECV